MDIVLVILEILFSTEDNLVFLDKKDLELVVKLEVFLQQVMLIFLESSLHHHSLVLHQVSQIFLQDNLLGIFLQLMDLHFLMSMQQDLVLLF